MLQNHCKGMNFSLNNQNKTHKKTHPYHIFLDLGWVWNADIAKMRHY